jgi:hypothetical protein
MTPLVRIVRMTRRASLGGMLRARAVAQLVMAHRRLIGGNMLQGECPHYRAPLGLAWSKAQGMDGPRRRPHDAQRAREEAAGGWMVGGKVNMGVVHGQRHMLLTHLRGPACSEEDGRLRCEAHRHGQRRRSSTTGKVLLRRLGEDPQGKVVLCDLQHGREGW